MSTDRLFNFSSVLNKVKEKVALTSEHNYIPDIMEFCYSKNYLNLKNIDRVGSGISLYPLQQIILKCFYKGQPGNEHLKLDKTELQYLLDNKMDDVLSKYHSDANFRELILVAGRRCIGENTEILLENGEIKTVKELVDNNISTITCFGINEENYNICKNPNSEIFFNGIQDLYRVTLNNGSYIDVTDNHPFLTVNGWVETKFLKIKDRVATPKVLPVFGQNSEVTNSEASLLGYMIGDGTYTQSIPRFACKNKYIKEHFGECLKNFSDKISIKNDKSQKLIYYRITKKKRNNKPNDLSLLLNKHGLKNKTSHIKFVPSAVLKSSESVIVSFLKALFSCDGSIYLKYNKRDKNYKPAITYTSVSEKLIRDVQGLLLRFGIFSILRKRIIDTNFKKNVTVYEININNASDIAVFLNKISFTGKDEKIKYIKNKYILKNKSNNISYSLPREIWKIVDNINAGKYSDREILQEKVGGNSRCHRQYSPSRHKIKTISDSLGSKTLEKLSNNSILWLPIKNIEYIGKQKTYDISVPIENQHNFIANNIITHNSGKTTLTSIIASYECMRLLECPNGSPFSYYGLASGNPIYIISIANSADQAKVLFTEIKQRLQMSDYFRNKIGKIEMDRIWLKTPEDQRSNKELISAGVDNAQTSGSVCIMSGHSNSDGLLGKRIFCCAADSQVISSKGLLPIESFATKGENIDVIVHGIEGEVVADKIFDNGISETFVFSTKSGNKIEVTPEHKLVVWNEDAQNIEYLEAKNIKISDTLIGQYNQNVWGSNADFKFKWSIKTEKYGDKIECPICHEDKEQINPQHLKSHGITSKEFGIKYPNYPTRSDMALLKFNNKNRSKIPKKMTEELARFLGYFVSEGNNTINNFNISNTNLDVVEDVYKCMTSCFDNVKLIKKKPSKEHIKNNYKQPYVIRVFSKQTRDFLCYIGCKKSYSFQKEVPWSVLSSSKKIVIEFLRACFEGDGSISDEYIYYVTTSEKLAYQIRYLLLNMGIFSTTYTKIPKHGFLRGEEKTNETKCKKQFIVKITGIDAIIFCNLIKMISTEKCERQIKLVASLCSKSRKKNKFGLNVDKTIKQTNIKHYEILKKYKKLYGFYCHSNQETQSLSTIKKWQIRYKNNDIKTILDVIIDSNLYGDKVTNITKSQSRVYDFHVDSASHSFCANGLLNHNSLLFDEVATYKATSGPNSGERLYTALGPATADFKRPNSSYIDPSDGLTKPILDSKIISISSPRGEEGIFYTLWSTAPKSYNRLAFQAKTWKMNLGISELSLRSEFKYMTPSEFAMEFGAEFSGTTGEKFISDIYVDGAVQLGNQLGLKQKTVGSPGNIYYAHLDPASTSHNYALLVLHIEEHWRTTTNQHGLEKKEKAKIYIVDHIKVWRPLNGQSIKVQEVDDYIINLAQRFRFGLVTYDSWNSIGSIQKLRSKGISSKCTPFRRQYKMFMYNNLEQLLVNKQLGLPCGTVDTDLLINELKSIKRIYGPQGFRIKPDLSGLVNTDDVCDALAGCCAIATETMTSGAPKGVLTYLPQKSANDMTWNIGGSNYSTSTWNFLNKKFGKLD